ncbi:MFS transporter [Rhodospirillaceae bacterium SYSU D60014]|uniref:MFS transporter n=1 Tax=Virgifigura deserti TaxID=2268457 RepID=UPI000E673D1A
MNRPQLYGWLVVGLCFLALSLAFSARSVLGLTMPFLEADLGSSRSFVSTGGAIALVLMAVIAPVAGNLVDRFGPRILLSAGLVAVGIGMVLTAGVTEPWQFILAFSVVAGLGFGVAATHVVSTVVSLQFERNRGLAVGIATSGSTAGQLLVIPLLASVLATTGWRWSYLALGLASLALIPVVLVLIRRQRSGDAAAASRQAAEPLGRRLSFLWRSPVFHLLFWSFTICGFTTSGVIETHLLPYAAACGFPPLASATAYGVLSAVNLGGMMLAGYLADRVNRPLLLGAIYILRGLSFILLMFVANDLSLLFIFAVAFGLFDYSTLPVTASLVASHLGLRIMGLAMGFLSAGHSLGAAAGAFLGGYLFDLFARYSWVWVASVILAIIAGLLVFAIRETRDRTAVALAGAE